MAIPVIEKRLPSTEDDICMRWRDFSGDQILDKVVSDLLNELGRSEGEFLRFIGGDSGRDGYAISMLSMMLEVQRNYGGGSTESVNITLFGKEPLIPGELKASAFIKAK
jgi:hypothetical protein